MSQYRTELPTQTFAIKSRHSERFILANDGYYKTAAKAREVNSGWDDDGSDLEAWEATITWKRIDQ